MTEKKTKQKLTPKPAPKTEELVAWKPSMPLSFESFRRHLNKLISKDEAEHLAALCIKNKLDPFKIPPEVHIIKYSEKDPAALVVGYQVYLQRAEKMVMLGKSAGYEKGTIVEKNTDIGKRGYVHKAFCRIHRPDWKVPFYHEVWLDEYTRPGPFWKNSPAAQLEKVAVGQAHRLCFSSDFEDLGYFVEEYGLGSTERIPQIEFGESEKVKKEPEEVVEGEVVEEEAGDEMGATEEKIEPEPTTEPPEIPTEPIPAEKPNDSEGKDTETAEKAPETALESPIEQLPLVAKSTEKEKVATPTATGVLSPILAGLKILEAFNRDIDEITELLINRINVKFHNKKPERKVLTDLNEAERTFAMRVIEITIQSEKDKAEGRKK